MLGVRVRSPIRGRRCVHQPRNRGPAPAGARNAKSNRPTWLPGGRTRRPNPVAHSNVCPEIDPPTTPSFYAFSYTVPSANSAARSFVAAGSGEAREGGPNYEGRIIRRGDQSPEAMCEKARFVLGAMEQRMAALGFGWAV